MVALLGIVAVLGALFVWPVAVRAERRRRIAEDLRKNAEGRATLLKTLRVNGGGLARGVLGAALVIGVLLAVVWVTQHPERPH